jgi:hypothetical protein
MQYGNSNESTAIGATIQAKKVKVILSYKFLNTETTDAVKSTVAEISDIGGFLAKPLGSLNEMGQKKADETLKKIDKKLKNLLINGHEEIYGELMESRTGLEILYARHFHMSKEKAERYA